MEQLETLVKRSHPLQGGDFLFRAGDPLHNIYAIRSGKIISGG